MLCLKDSGKTFSEPYKAVRIHEVSVAINWLEGKLVHASRYSECQQKSNEACCCV